MKIIFTYKSSLILVAVFCLLFSIVYHQNIKKSLTRKDTATSFPPTTKKASELELKINAIINEIDQRIPKGNFSNKDNTTSARNSKTFLVNPKEKYCVGDRLTVQVDAYDFLGKKKTYGGDYLRARISSAGIGAGASGRIEDCNNGTYFIYFTLFWEGKVLVTVFLMHPSEAVSALWKSRNSWYGNTGFLGKFTNQDKKVETKCGFDLNSKELCEYKDARDEEYFYCIKPQNFSCDSYTEFKSWKTLDSQLSKLQNSLLVRSNVRLVIANNFQEINVFHCRNASSENKERCKTGMKLEYPSGYVMNGIWYPKDCSMKTYHTMEELNTCMKGKFFYMFGDSTMHQWMTYFENKLKCTLYIIPVPAMKLLNVYEDGWAQKHLAVDIERNIHIMWKRHGRPFINLVFVSNTEEHSIPREIDLIGGNQYTVITLNIGIHFRLFPVHHYIRRLINIRRSIERLFLRSPQTKVIIKTENTSAMENEYEGMSDFHGFVHYLIMEMVFKNLNVGFVNGWDMTTAFNTNQIHPPEVFIRNEINMLMTYICS